MERGGEYEGYSQKNRGTGRQWEVGKVEGVREGDMKRGGEVEREKKEQAPLLVVLQG